MSDSLSLTLPRWDGKIKVRLRKPRPPRWTDIWRAFAVLSALLAGVHLAEGDLLSRGHWLNLIAAVNFWTYANAADRNNQIVMSLCAAVGLGIFVTSVATGGL